MENMKKTSQNSYHLFLVNLLHGRASKFCKRQITQLTSKRLALPTWTCCDNASPPTDLGNYQQDLTPAVNRQPGHRRGNSPSYRE